MRCGILENERMDAKQAAMEMIDTNPPANTEMLESLYNVDWLNE